MKRWKYFLIGALVFAGLCSSAAYALPEDFGTATLNAFNGVVATDIHNFVNDPSTALHQFAWIEWTFFTILLISSRGLGWALGTTSTVDLALSAIMILVVAAILTSYDTITTQLWSFSDIGIAYQEAVLGHGGDPMWPATQLQHLIENVQIEDVNFFTAPLKIIFWTALYVILSVVVSLAFYISSAWSVFGYGMVKIVGFAIVPLVMHEWTRGLFDGWIKLFVGFMLYNVLARVIMVMLIRFYENAIGATPQVVNPEADFGSYIGVIAMYAIGIAFLFSASGFAAIMAGGFTSASSAGRSVARVASNIAKVFA